MLCSKGPGCIYSTLQVTSIIETVILFPCVAAAFEKDVNLITSVQRKFVRRLCWRCSLSSEEVHLPSIESLLHNQNIRMLYQLYRINMIDHFFDLSQNSRRSGLSITPKAVARTDRINNLYSWRLTRHFHESSS